MLLRLLHVTPRPRIARTSDAQPKPVARPTRLRPATRKQARAPSGISPAGQRPHASATSNIIREIASSDCVVSRESSRSVAASRCRVRRAQSGAAPDPNHRACHDQPDSGSHIRVFLSVNVGREGSRRCQYWQARLYRIFIQSQRNWRWVWRCVQQN